MFERRMVHIWDEDWFPMIFAAAGAVIIGAVALGWSTIYRTNAPSGPANNQPAASAAHAKPQPVAPANLAKRQDSVAAAVTPADLPPKFTPPHLDPDAPVNPLTVSEDPRENLDRLTTWIALEGRGIGCGFDTDSINARIQKWKLKVSTFEDPEHGIDMDTLNSVGELGLRQNAEAQLHNASPDTCTEVATSLKQQVWP